MDPILLHVCCGPCSTVAVPWWRAEGLEPLAVFVNPNIQPAAEYDRRREAMERFAHHSELELVVASRPGVEAWLAAAGSPAAASQADRCRACLSLRLREVAQAAAERRVGYLATSLTVSPWQRHDFVAQAGAAAAREAGIEYLHVDLRSHYRRSVDESRRLGLYRQPYCGCAASKWETWHERRARRPSSAA